MEELKSGTDWTITEVNIVVQTYFDYLNTPLHIQPRPKLHIYKEIAEKISRSHKAVERKFQNISAVLDQLGMEWITGLAPLHNYQKVLVSAVETHLENQNEPAAKTRDLNAFQHLPQAALERDDLSEIEFVDSPSATGKPREMPDYVERLVRKFDPSIRDFRNRRLGHAGESRVFKYEISRLKSIGRPDLACKVDWVAESKGDGAGYDILSFDENGNERFIEVKTTVGSETTPFFMTRNELEFSIEAKERYRLVRLFDFNRNPRAFKLAHPIDNSATITPDSYKVSFR